MRVLVACGEWITTPTPSPTTSLFSSFSSSPSSRFDSSSRARRRHGVCVASSSRSEGDKVGRIELKLARKTTTSPSSGGVSLPCLGCGTWAWGNRLLWGYENTARGDEELRRVYNFLVDRGVDLFDTGDSYGTGKLEGQSEKLLGRFRRERERSQQVQGAESGSSSSSSSTSAAVFATKLAAYPWRLTRGSWTEACRQSSERLQVDPIELVQLHWSVANYAPPQERLALWTGLGDIAENGMAKCIGVSNYGKSSQVKSKKQTNR